MPCFFFHLADGSMVKDQDGEVLPNTESARAHAARIAHELAEAGDYRGFAIKVTDEQGNEVAYIPIGKRCNSKPSSTHLALVCEILAAPRRTIVRDQAHRPSQAQ
jgi:hypothetical protein